MTDFAMYQNGMGLYSLAAMSPAATYRMGNDVIWFDRTDFAASCVAGLIGEGYSVSLDNRELTLEDCQQ